MRETRTNAERKRQKRTNMLRERDAQAHRDVQTDTQS